jgi:hypothetical protein
MFLRPEREINLVKFKRIFDIAKVGDQIDNALLINNVVDKVPDQSKNEVSVGSWCTLLIDGIIYTAEECIIIKDGIIKERTKYA